MQIHVSQSLISKGFFMELTPNVHATTETTNFKHLINCVILIKKINPHAIKITLLAYNATLLMHPKP